jgi:hypothetical protein
MLPRPHKRIETTEERDGLLAHDGESGMNQTYARLDELLARLSVS